MGDCFYEMNIIFNITWHLMFIEDVKTTSESQTYYKLPSYHGFDTYFLKQSKVIVSKRIVENIQNSTHKYGATICLNG